MYKNKIPRIAREIGDVQKERGERGCLTQPVIMTPYRTTVRTQRGTGVEAMGQCNRTARMRETEETQRQQQRNLMYDRG